jgi:hypothetical protein
MRWTMLALSYELPTHARRAIANWPRATRTLAFATLAATALACSEASAPAALQAEDESLPSLDAESEVRITLEPGLEQTLQLRPGRLHQGDELHIRSVVRNTSNEYKKAEALVCQLEIRTNMKFESIEPLILCFAYSVTVRLGPRDSLVLTAQGKVGSPPGTYVMAVRHLLRPDIVKKVRVRVYPRPSSTDRVSATQ